MGSPLLVLAAAAAAAASSGAVHKAPPPPPPTLEVAAAGVVTTGTVHDKQIDRFRLVPGDRGTLIISVDRILGPQARAVLRNAKGQAVRRADKRGKIWARPEPGTELFLEVTASDKEEASTYHLAVAFDLDRPKEQRGQQRAVRPRDIIKVHTNGVEELDQVLVGGAPADHSIHGGDVLVTIPAFARSGPVELRFESRAPKIVDIELIGAEPLRDDVVTDACSAPGGVQPGCLQFIIGPSVGSAWLAAIVKVLDADLTKHIVKTGAVEVKLRMPSSESYALELLGSMPGVISAQRAVGAPHP